MSAPRLLSDGTVVAQPGDQVSPGRARRGTLGGPVGDERGRVRPGDFGDDCHNLAFEQLLSLGDLTLPGDGPPAAIPSMSDDATFALGEFHRHECPAGHFSSRWTRPDDLGGDEPVAHCPKCGRMLVEAVELRD